MQRIGWLLIFFSWVSRAVADPAPVVGGEPVLSSQWPDVVGVLGEHGTCTGTLIAPDVVLTAGHCAGIEPHTVLTHANDLASGPRDRVAVKWTRAYPRWFDRYDVAVVVLQRMARVPPRAIATACVANEGLDGATLTVVGYGATTPDGNDENSRLHAAKVRVTDAFCKTTPGCLASVRPSGELVAGGDGTDSCLGDSGGPAYLDTPVGPALVGIVSRGTAVPGTACGNGGIYVRADKVVAWIQSVTERKLARVACARPADEAAHDAAEGEGGTGCATHGGGGFAVAVVLVSLLARQKRRRIAWLRRSLAVQPAAAWRRSR